MTATATQAATPIRIEIDYKPRQWAIPFHKWLGRWSALVLHRRAGKTTAVINHHQRAAIDDGWETRRLRHLSPTLTDGQVSDLLRNRYYGHVLPSLKQAELVAWKPLKYFAAKIPGIKVNESKLQIEYPTTTGQRSTVRLFGADNPDAFRGAPFSGISFDEYSQHPPDLFSEVISKSLADHLGYAVFAGTLKGKNQLYRAWEAGQGDPAWYTLWQDIARSLASEDDAATLMLRQAMHDDQQLISKGLMTQAEYDQEWYLSTDAAIHGAYYLAQLTAARKDGRLTRVPYDPLLTVDTDWDLGMRDEMTIWFSQSLRSREVRLIDYYEGTGLGIPHYVQVLRDRGYTYGQHWAPHDIQVRELGTGKSRLEVAGSLGITFQITPNIGIQDGIDAARLLFPRCWFDEQKCKVGIEALTQYHQGWNRRLAEFTGEPVHDWASHAADAFRGLAVRHKVPEQKRPARSYDVFAGTGAPGVGWMA